MEGLKKIIYDNFVWIWFLQKEANLTKENGKWYNK